MRGRISARTAYAYKGAEQNLREYARVRNLNIVSQTDAPPKGPEKSTLEGRLLLRGHVLFGHTPYASQLMDIVKRRVFRLTHNDMPYYIGTVGTISPPDPPIIGLFCTIEPIEQIDVAVAELCLISNALIYLVWMWQIDYDRRQQTIKLIKAVQA